MMEYSHFLDMLEKIYATFGKRLPQSAVIDRIYDRVGQLPDSFMDFALKYFEDQDDLPKNMGGFLINNLWPEYLANHPELRARHEVKCCPLCDIDLPGWRRVYEPEITGWGRKVYKPVHVRCTCGGYPNPNQERVYQDFELEQMGYKIDCPYEWDRDNPPECLRKALSRVLVGADDTEKSDAERRRFSVYVE